MDNLRVGIVGNIGVGKSTLSEAMISSPIREILLGHLPSRSRHEDLHMFQEEFDPTVLDSFYKDPARHAFMAQVEFFNGRLARQKYIDQARGIVLLDRTIREDYHIFGKAQKVMGHLTEAEYIAYQRNFNLMVEKIRSPDLIVYLRVDTDTLMRRIARRGRESERAISRDYLDLFILFKSDIWPKNKLVTV